MPICPFCDQTFSRRPSSLPGPGQRLAYDPWNGRLWEVCGSCSRWILVPMEERWETLEACEEAVRSRGKVVLASENLSLVRIEDGDLVRVGEPPRVEFVGWRYGRRVPPPAKKPAGGLLTSILEGIPAPPPGGYEPYRLTASRTESGWLASPFLPSAWALTTIFSHIPFADECPSCGRVMPLQPWDFQHVSLVQLAVGPGIRARCGLCGDDVVLDLREARPVLRLGLSLVIPARTLQEEAESAGTEVDRLGGRDAFLGALGRERVTLGEAGPLERIALGIVLDEAAEVEALEAEWRVAEEISAIIDRELTDAPGFDEFRKRIQESGNA